MPARREIHAARSIAGLVGLRINGQRRAGRIRDQMRRVFGGLWLLRPPGWRGHLRWDFRLFGRWGWFGRLDLRRNGRRGSWLIRTLLCGRGGYRLIYFRWRPIVK